MISIIAVSLNFLTSSCDDDNHNPESPDANKPADSSKVFIGSWKQTSEKRNRFLFFEDGKAKEIYRYSISTKINTNWYLSEARFGSWTYNDKTEYLATTIGGWQFAITLSNDTEWAG